KTLRRPISDPLKVRNKGKERRDAEEPLLLLGSERSMQAPRKHELKLVGVHFIGLVLGNPGFQCQQMFARNARRLGEYLPPAVLAGGFNSEHGEAVRR